MVSGKKKADKIGLTDTDILLTLWLFPSGTIAKKDITTFGYSPDAEFPA